MLKKKFIVGSGGHASVIYEILAKDNSFKIIFIEKKRVDNNIISEKDFFYKYKNKKVEIYNGIGFSTKNNNRKLVDIKFEKKKFIFNKLISPNAFLYGNIEIAVSAQIFNNVIIQNNSKIGFGTIVNTGSIIEHDVTIGNNCFIGPGCVICGNVKISDDVYLGPNVTVAAGVKIGSKSKVALGSSIYKNIKSNSFIK